jgi:spoIIIJ-associated protein
MTDETTLEASGETVGEAKWAALRELERRFPGLDRQAVTFQVLSEGERGLMGIGREPARVVATVGGVPAGDERPTPPPAAGRGDHAPPTRRDARPVRRPAAVPAPTGPQSDTAAAREVRSVVDAIAAGLGLEADVHVAEDDEAVTATLTGADLGVLIGKHGRTIDAVQYIVNAITNRGVDVKPVVIDAQNYRHRREVALHETALRAVADVSRTGRPVSLEPMTSVERKIVHLFLKDHADVETASDGREPYRHVVVVPRAT